MNKTGINLAEMYEETTGTEKYETIEQKPKKLNLKTEFAEMASREVQTLGNNVSRNEPPNFEYSVTGNPSNVSNILANLPETAKIVSTEQIEEVIESVFSRLIENREEKMISFRGNKTTDDFFLQLQANIKSYANKKVSKEKIMDLILQIVMRDPNHRKIIIGGVLEHLLNSK